MPFENSPPDRIESIFSIPFFGAKALYDIDAVDKARSVPYISIQEIDWTDNEPVGEPITLSTVAPPSFGNSVGRFNERPNVSLETVTVKQNYAKGWWLFSEVDISLVVHRPEHLSEPNNAIARLITPGRHFLLEYGWVGGNNPILGGGVEPDNSAKRVSDPGVPAKQDSRAKFSSLNRIRLLVATYSFEVKPDGSIGLHVKAYQDGEQHIRTVTFMDQPGSTDKTRWADKKKQIVASISSHVKKGTGYITALDLLNVVVAGPLTEAYKSLGYRDVFLELGSFNEECPTTSYNGTVAGKALGDFHIDVQSVQTILENSLAQGKPMTVQAFIESTIINPMNDPASWKETKGASMPDVATLTFLDPNSGTVLLTILDRKSFLKRIHSALSHENVQGQKELLKQSLEQKKIPVVSLWRAQNFIQGSKFEAMAQDSLRDLFLSRAIKKDRDRIAAQDPRKFDQENSLSSGLLLFRSAIRGSMTMIGNFVFNTFGYMWINFGIPEWDGLFYVVERSDKIGRDGFSTILTVQAEGSNPLASPDPVASNSEQQKAPEPEKKGPAKKGTTKDGAKSRNWAVKVVGKTDVVKKGLTKMEATREANRLNKVGPQKFEAFDRTKKAK